MEVFKFCKLDFWAVKNLYYSHFYFSDVESLNDAGECLFNIEDDVSGNEEKRKCFIRSVKDIYIRYDFYFSDMFSHYLRRAEKNGTGFKELAAYTLAAVLKAHKTCSFTNQEGVLNPIMWGHYGDNSKGVCLHYKVEYDNSGSIDYVTDEDVEKIKVSEIELSSLSDLVKRIFFKKSKDWKYEKEFRLVSDKNIVKVNPECLKGVYFGVNVNESDAIFLMDVVKEKYGKVDWAVVFHPRVENKMRCQYFNTKEQFLKILERRNKEDVFGGRYLVEKAMREAYLSK